MPDQRIGTCSICGGDVYGWVGAWWGTQPPPPPPPLKCRNCGAVSAAHDPVIPMRRARPFARRFRSTTDGGYAGRVCRCDASGNKEIEVYRGPRRELKRVAIDDAAEWAENQEIEVLPEGSW